MSFLNFSIIGIMSVSTLVAEDLEKMDLRNLFTRDDVSGIVVDNTNNYMWQDDVGGKNAFGTYFEALDYCSNSVL